MGAQGGSRTAQGWLCDLRNVALALSRGGTCVGDLPRVRPAAGPDMCPPAPSVPLQGRSAPGRRPAAAPCATLSEWSASPLPPPVCTPPTVHPLLPLLPVLWAVHSAPLWPCAVCWVPACITPIPTHNPEPPAGCLASALLLSGTSATAAWTLIHASGPPPRRFGHALRAAPCLALADAACCAHAGLAHLTPTHHTDSSLPHCRPQIVAALELAGAGRSISGRNRRLSRDGKRPEGAGVEGDGGGDGGMTPSPFAAVSERSGTDADAEEDGGANGVWERIRRGGDLSTWLSG